MRAPGRQAGSVSTRPGWLTPAVRFMAVASLMLILGAGAYGTSIHLQRQRIKALRAEHQQIETELQRVKEATNQAQPVVVLENGDTRVIVDVKDSQQPTPIYY